METFLLLAVFAIAYWASDALLRVLTSTPEHEAHRAPPIAPLPSPQIGIKAASQLASSPALEKCGQYVVDKANARFRLAHDDPTVLFVRLYSSKNPLCSSAIY